MLNFQVPNIEGALKWLKTCPFEYTISSMQGGFIHVKIFIPINKPMNKPMNKEVKIEEK